ncbi:signal peptide peptidase SppA [Ensifer soli]|uniref:signal peptide peptidase SppA n=1 Tax=Ciceribacter sp. sgz301302 TaxID=3342379 RepID=UPI0035BA61C5
MDMLAIADRQALRRKLTFWRIAAIAVIAAAGIAIYAFAGASGQRGSFSAHIARITLAGVIQDDRDLVARIDRIAGDSAVKALVVTISSPGGTTYGGEVIYKALRRVAANKPVIADIRTLAASAGYMVALAGDEIVAGETSITGSIGVIFQYPQVKDLLDRLGISLEEIKSAPLKAEPSPFHPPSDAAKAVIQAMIDDSFAWFVNLVVERRKLPREAVLPLADGRIFTGRQALKAGLVDRLGGEEEIRAALQARDVPAGLPVIDWDPRPTGLPSLVGGLAKDLAKALGYDAFPLSETLERLGREKLFLDGLVSVWQVAPIRSVD